MQIIPGRLKRLVATSLSLVGICLTGAFPASAASTAQPPDGIGVSSTRTGDYEGGWGIIYGILEYYGDDTAAGILIKETIEKVHSCPFSAADKADFDRWIAASKVHIELSINYGYGHGYIPPTLRPNLPDDEASRTDAAKIAAEIEVHPQTLRAGPCETGSGPDS